MKRRTQRDPLLDGARAPDPESLMWFRVTLIIIFVIGMYLIVQRNDDSVDAQASRASAAAR